MDNHIQNLKKVCRFCGQKKDCLKPLTSYVRGKRLKHKSLYTQIFETSSIHPVPKEKFCYTCSKRLISLSNDFHFEEKEAAQKYACDLKDECFVFSQHLDDCVICTQFENVDQRTSEDMETSKGIRVRSQDS